MENASKALIIAGAILLAIAIIGIGMYVYNNAQEAISGTDMTQQQVQTYNEEFTRYQGSIKGSRARTLCNNIASHNRTAQDDSEKIGVFTSAGNTDYDAGQTTGTTTAEINQVINGLQSGLTYDVSFGFDPASGMVTAVYIVESSSNP